jgi:hypothetical protein
MNVPADFRSPPVGSATPWRAGENQPVGSISAKAKASALLIRRLLIASAARRASMHPIG